MFVVVQVSAASLTNQFDCLGRPRIIAPTRVEYSFFSRFSIHFHSLALRTLLGTLTHTKIASSREKCEKEKLQGPGARKFSSQIFFSPLPLRWISSFNTDTQSSAEQRADTRKFREIFIDFSLSEKLMCVYGDEKERNFPCVFHPLPRAAEAVSLSFEVVSNTWQRRRRCVYFSGLSLFMKIAQKLNTTTKRDLERVCQPWTPNSSYSEKYSSSLA